MNNKNTQDIAENTMPSSYSLAEIAAKTNSKLIRGDEDTKICAPRLLADAGKGDIVFWIRINNAEKRLLETTEASAIMTTTDKLDNLKSTVPKSCAILVSEVPQDSFVSCLELFQERRQITAHISKDADISTAASIGKNTQIESQAVIQGSSLIGENCYIGSGVVIADKVRIGDDVIIKDNSVIEEGVSIGSRVKILSSAIVGGEPFSYKKVGEGDRMKYQKIPSLGGVIIEDDVTIGANSVIIRGIMGDTIIGSGTKIDSQCFVAQDNQIGKSCVLCGFVSVEEGNIIEDYCLLGGRSFVGRNNILRQGTKLHGTTLLTKSTKPGSIVAGFLGMDYRDWWKIVATVRKLALKRK